MNGVLGRILTLLGGVYLLLILVLPFQYMPLKLSIIAVIYVVLFCHLLLKGHVIVLSSIVMWLLTCVLSGCFFILLGSSKADVDSYLYTVMLYVVFPLVYFPLILAYSRTDYIISGCKVIVYSSFLILLYVTLFFLGSVGLVGFNVELAGDNNAAFQNGVAIVKLGVISTLVYLLPFLIALLLNYRLNVNKIAPKFIIVTALVATVISVFLSGRRAVLLMLLISPVLVLGFNFFLPEKKRLVLMHAVSSIAFFAVIVIFGVFLLQKTLDFNIYGVLERFFLVLGLHGGALGGEERSEQVEFFLSSINESPFLGLGHGVVAEIVRDADKPWRYELSYLAMLFHTGIVGTVIYGGAILWIYLRGLRIIRQGGLDASIMIAMLAGLTSMLLSYSTNPYLDAFDALWVIFFPVTFINAYFMQKKYHYVFAR